MSAYGQEMILDLHRCERTEPTEEFFERLCKLIGMEREDLHFWGPAEGGDAENELLSGVSAVQFIRTSSVVIHGLDIMGTVYVNLFSCAPFDVFETSIWIKEWFGAKKMVRTVVVRTMP